MARTPGVFAWAFRTAGVGGWLLGVYGVLAPMLISAPNTIAVIAGLGLTVVGLVPPALLARSAHRHLQQRRELEAAVREYEEEQKREALQDHRHRALDDGR